MHGAAVLRRYSPRPTLLLTLPLLKPSAPFAVHCHFAEPLADIQTHLLRTRAAVNIDLTSTFHRVHQVMPNRTHPAMRMDNASGFVLSGVRTLVALVAYFLCARRPPIRLPFCRQLEGQAAPTRQQQQQTTTATTTTTHQRHSQRKVPPASCRPASGPKWTTNKLFIDACLRCVASAAVALDAVGVKNCPSAMRRAQHHYSPDAQSRQPPEWLHCDTAARIWYRQCRLQQWGTAAAATRRTTCTATSSAQTPSRKPCQSSICASASPRQAARNVSVTYSQRPLCVKSSPASISSPAANKDESKNRF